jgi:hypothetical protein
MEESSKLAQVSTISLRRLVSEFAGLGAEALQERREECDTVRYR